MYWEKCVFVTADKQLSGSTVLDICRYLKSHNETKDIPVIMISASPDIGGQSINAGADGYIEKPFEIAHLLKVIDHYCVRKGE
jgi:CheY-like chemotaxis protein